MENFDCMSYFLVQVGFPDRLFGGFDPVWFRHFNFVIKGFTILRVLLILNFDGGFFHAL